MLELVIQDDPLVRKELQGKGLGKGEEMNAYTEESEYKGYPTIKIFTGHEYKGEKEYITLGVRKAAAVDDCIDAIRIFVDKHRRGDRE
jgi:hypothetical protein